MKQSATRKKSGSGPPAYSFYRSSRRPDSQKAAEINPKEKP